MVNSIEWHFYEFYCFVVRSYCSFLHFFFFFHSSIKAVKETWTTWILEKRDKTVLHCWCANRKNNVLTWNSNCMNVWVLSKWKRLRSEWKEMRKYSNFICPEEDKNHNRFTPVSVHLHKRKYIRCRFKATRWVAI